MSWQSYVDDQLLSTKVIKNAVIAGHDGNIWATSAGFNVSCLSKKTESPQKRANFLPESEDTKKSSQRPWLPTGFCEDWAIINENDHSRL